MLDQCLCFSVFCLFPVQNDTFRVFPFLHIILKFFDISPKLILFWSGSLTSGFFSRLVQELSPSYISFYFVLLMLAKSPLFTYRKTFAPVFSLRSSSLARPFFIPFIIIVIIILFSTFDHIILLGFLPLMSLWFSCLSIAFVLYLFSFSFKNNLPFHFFLYFLIHLIFSSVSFFLSFF